MGQGLPLWTDRDATRDAPQVWSGTEKRWSIVGRESQVSPGSSSPSSLLNRPPHLILPPLSLPQVMGLRDQLRGITSCGFLCLLSPSPTLNLPLSSSLPPPGHGSAGSATRTPEASCCAP